MLKIGILGLGRIGRLHANNCNICNIKIGMVYDYNHKIAEQVSFALNTKMCKNPEELIQSSDVDAVIIATPTETHIKYIEQISQLKKPIFCEKPIDLNLSLVKKCIDNVKKENTKLFVAFNRRFDPQVIKARQAIIDGKIGKVQSISIISRDPAPPSYEYILSSGGIFKDMMIHDFDMARFLMGEELHNVAAFGSNLFSAHAKKANDFDTATAMLKTKKGQLCQILVSRQSSSGYDQSININGASGSIKLQNYPETQMKIENENGCLADPNLNFFLERYEQSYKNELKYFANCVSKNLPFSPSGEDGLKALELAVLAQQYATRND